MGTTQEGLAGAFRFMSGSNLVRSLVEVAAVANETYYAPVNSRQFAGGGFSPGRAAGWLVLIGTLAFMGLTAYVGWNWLDSTCSVSVSRMPAR